MSIVSSWRREETNKHAVPAANVIGQAASELCEKALSDAKAQLHPLLRNVEVERLEQRNEFLQAFKSALERRIARKLAAWQPGVQAVFQFDETRMKTIESWDGSIHLLVKVPRLSNAIKMLGKALDKSLVRHLKQFGWPHFETRQSILEVQQVTPNEIRRGIRYGAMFFAVYSVPVKVWP